MERSDVRTYHHHLHTQFAHSCTVYVGLVQARPNKSNSGVKGAYSFVFSNISVDYCPRIMTVASPFTESVQSAVKLIKNHGLIQIIYGATIHPVAWSKCAKHQIRSKKD